MAKYSMKKGGKEVGPASTYAEPHTMNGKGLTINQLDGYRNDVPDPNTLKAQALNPSNSNVPRVSMGDPGPGGIKTAGIKIRGTGAATKGIFARGPMA